MKINLMSDTVTVPDMMMLEAMVNAEVGDDVFGADPTVNKLQDRVANMFGKKAALFCPSGTMTNQIAIKSHTEALDELICEVNSHVYQYETGGYAFNSGVAINLIKGKNSKLQPKDIKAAFRPSYDWLPKSSLLVLENSCNRGGGNYYTLAEMAEISKLCKSIGLKIHLDGARIFNVLVETGDSTKAIGNLFDSISICLSKGLGAPVGSLLIGSKSFIRKARRFRKVLGGGMRQAGFLAAAGLYALDYNIERLKRDNERAKRLELCLNAQEYVSHVKPVYTNIVIFDLKGDISAHQFLKKLDKHGISAVAFGPQTIRFTTHKDFTEEMCARVIDVLEKELHF